MYLLKHAWNTIFIPKDSYSIENRAKGQAFRYDSLKYVHVDRRAKAGIVGGGVQIDGVLPPVALHIPYSLFVKMFLVKKILFIRRYSLASKIRLAWELNYCKVLVLNVYTYVKKNYFDLEFFKGLQNSWPLNTKISPVLFFPRKTACVAQTDLFSNRPVFKKYGNYSFLC